MGIEFVVVVLCVGVALMIGAVPRGRRDPMDDDARQWQAWVNAAYALGLKPGAATMTGARDGRAISIERSERADSSTLQLEVTIEGGLPEGLALGPGGGAKTGDPDFDASVRAEGSHAPFVLTFGSPLRLALQAVISHGWQLRDGRLVVTYRSWNVDGLEPIVSEGLAVAALLSETTRDIAAGLVRRVAEDPAVAVRHAALRALATRTHGAEALREALGFAVKDEDEGLRFEAAELAWDLSAMRELAAGGHAKALRLLAGRASQAAVVAELVRQWLRQGHARTPESAAALAFALGQVSIPEGEAALADLLGHAYEAVQLEAIGALGRIGTAASVVVLTPFRERLFGELKHAARDAILAIQARVQVHETGALSLAAGEAGAVALAPAQGSERAVEEA